MAKKDIETKFERDNRENTYKYMIISIDDFNKYLNGKAKVLERCKDLYNSYEAYKKACEDMQETVISLKEYEKEYYHASCSVENYEKNKPFSCIVTEQLGIHLEQCHWCDNGRDLEIIFR